MKSGDRWALGVSAAVMTLTALPYLVAYSHQGTSPLFGWYSWFLFNTGDQCVYLSWMRQYADGAWFQHNLFTTVPQPGYMVNALFLALGKVARWTGLPLVLVYHTVRILSGMIFLRLVWKLATMLIPDESARRLAFLTVLFSAGLGWIPADWHVGIGIERPVDLWQPEAISFLSIYLLPLFSVSLALMLGVLINLLEAERTRGWRPVIIAGILGFFLGNIHTYDVITLTVIWASYIAANGLYDERLFWPMLRRALVAALPAALSTGYMLWLYRTDAVFAQRVESLTLAPAVWWVLLGFGLLVPLALIGLVALRWSSLVPGPPASVQRPHLFLAVWAVANIAAAYIPVSFERKLLMGAHIPIALLAGVGLWWILMHLRASSWRPWAALAMVLLATTNVFFVLRDLWLLPYAPYGAGRPFLLAGEKSALDWLRRSVSPNAVVQPLPWIAVQDNGRVKVVDTTVASFTPGLTGHSVNAGHWSETPHFYLTMENWQRFLMPDTPDEWRRSVLRSTGVRYLIFSQKRAETIGENSVRLLARSPVMHVPGYLRRVPEASNADADVFEVLEP